MTTIPREGAIRAIRAKLLELVDDDHSMCQVARDKGIFCRGFDLSDDEFRQRYSWLTRKDRSMSREELEDRANRWQLARQIVNKVPISCDAQALERDTCEGWDRFDDATLARFYLELTGQEVTIRS